MIPRAVAASDLALMPLDRRMQAVRGAIGTTWLARRRRPGRDGRRFRRGEIAPALPRCPPRTPITVCERSDNIAFMQLELFPYDRLTQTEQHFIHSEIRRHYWHIRNLRDGRFGQARLRKHYRMVAAQKKRLLMAGVSKREILDLLACCRLQCSRARHPFQPCQFCP